ncbi:mechanosensitive ion channel family protein [Comamonadaceae bacterium OH2545_COT-014]|nr:mechanosensitive ion channel family protein [Comamonadaceae bacterium OH2545_COT-014]
MNTLWSRILARLPDWAQELLQVLLPALQVLLIMAAAVLLQRLLRRLIRRVAASYHLPAEFNVLTLRLSSFVIFGSALLMALERLGVSSAVLWGAFTSFAAVGAVAFFAAWSVLSNVFCSLLIFTTRLLRLGDYVEVLENGDKPGLKGRVVDINLIYTTLDETGDAEQGTLLKVPNSLLFQRTLRQWSGHASAPTPLPAKPFHETPAPLAPPPGPAAP